MKNEPQRTSTLPNGNDIRLPWHLRLPAPLERDFADYFRGSVASVTPWAAASLVALLILALIVEYTISPEAAAVTWRPRLLCVMLIVATALIARRADWRRWLHVSSLAVAFAVALTGNWMGLNVDHAMAFGLFLQTPLAILMACVVLRVPFHLAAVSSLAMLGILVLTLFGSDRVDRDLSLVLLLLSVASASMSLFGQYIYERLLRQHFLSENVLFQHRDELHSANRILENQATVDGLTGCLNRRGMENRLDEVLHGFGRGGVSERITLVLFDIDFFKQYNDTYGHLAGDDCLKTVASIPRSMAQNSKDFVARYGGEEFSVMLPGAQEDMAKIIAERLRASIADSVVKSDKGDVQYTVSIGIACATGKDVRIEELLDRADRALYTAKAQGRNRAVFDSAA